MNLSISNIAWADENNKIVYELMGKLNYRGLEIAPTRIFANAPYERIEEATAWAFGGPLNVDIRV